jgi:ribosome recycling factor
LAKDAEAFIQDMTNNFAKKIDAIISAKEDQIMTV